VSETTIIERDCFETCLWNGNASAGFSGTGSGEQVPHHDVALGELAPETAEKVKECSGNGTQQQ
jgi:hypothetical protein